MTVVAIAIALGASVALLGGCKKAGPAQVDPSDRDRPDDDASRHADPTATTKDPAVTIPISKAPPTAKQPPAQDTARYVAWMAQQGKPISDTPREAVELRIGNWGFFDHGAGPGQALDRAGIDQANHVVQPQEQGHWHAFLTTPGLDASGALRRVAWLFSALELRADPKMPKVTAATLEKAPDGSLKLQGWLAFPPNMSTPMRITITATPGGAKLSTESATQP